MMVQEMVGGFQAPWVGPRPEAPPLPRRVEEVATPHAIHALITIVGGLFTFGLLFGWVIVWILHAIVNDLGNRKERRRFDEDVLKYRRNVQVYEAELHAWQDRHFRAFGWAPQVAPIPRF